MNLKRYQAQTVQEALRDVREELGPDALVLSTRMVPAPGPRGWLGGRLVEITAAADRPSVPEVRQPEPVAPVVRESREDRAAGEIAARLAAAGVAPALARAAALAAPAQQRRGLSIRALRVTLADQLAPIAANDTGYAPVEVFIGPPGVGKTATVAKIAARELAGRGHRLGLLAANGFRVGAAEGLRVYARILGAPVQVVRTPFELQGAIESATCPVLVDTAGRSVAEDASVDMLRVFAGRTDVRTHLVLAADAPAAAVERALDRFASARPDRLVLTRLDEAGSLGPLLGLLRERGIPVSYLGTGQEVPDDLDVATAGTLARWATGDEPGRAAVASGRAAHSRGGEVAECAS